MRHGARRFNYISYLDTSGMTDSIEQPDSKLVVERLDTSKKTDSNILAVMRGKLGARRVDWKIRSHEGAFEYACEYYDDGSLLHVGDWERFEFVGIDKTGNTVNFAHVHGGGTMDFDEWVEGAAEEYIMDEITEIWSEVKEMHESD